MKLDRDGLLRALQQLPAATTSLSIVRDEVPSGEVHKSGNATLITDILKLDEEIAAAIPDGLKVLRTEIFRWHKSTKTLASKLDNVTELHITDSLLDDDQLCDLAAGISPGQLEVLELHNNSFGEEGLEVILAGQTNLRTLDLSRNSLGYEPIDVLTDFLRTANPPLETLNLSKTKLFELKSFEGVTMPQLHTLCLSDNRLLESPLSILETVAPNLTTVDMSYNKLGKRQINKLRADPRAIALNDNPGVYTWRTKLFLLASFVLTTLIGFVNESWGTLERVGVGLLVVVVLIAIRLPIRTRERTLEEERREPPELES